MYSGVARPRVQPAGSRAADRSLYHLLLTWKRASGLLYEDERSLAYSISRVRNSRLTRATRPSHGSPEQHVPGTHTEHECEARTSFPATVVTYSLAAPWRGRFPLGLGLEPSPRGASTTGHFRATRSKSATGRSTPIQFAWPVPRLGCVKSVTRGPARSKARRFSSFGRLGLQTSSGEDRSGRKGVKDDRYQS